MSDANQGAPGTSAAGTDAGADVAPAALPDLGPGSSPGPQAGLDLLADVNLEVTVELGRVDMRMRDLLALREGSVVELEQMAGDPVDVLVNGTLVARGEVVVVGDELGVRVTDIVTKKA